MLINNITNYLSNKSYNINISKNQLYINNYKKLDNINDKNITIIFEDFKLNIEGIELKIIKMLNKEILFNGQIESIKIIPLK